MMVDLYRRWDDREAVGRFAEKTAGDFFTTETHFLANRAAELESVFDIGCASGRFVELLASLGARPAYTGIDVSPAQIDSARRIYPNANFHLGNALEFELAGLFDLVNATGVMQHEPQFAKLIERMIGWSRRYVLFDVKLSMLDDDIVDIDRARAGTPDHPLYFNILSTSRLMDRLKSLFGVVSISVYGYETAPNASTVVPPEVTCLVSAGILLELGDGPVRLTVELPDKFVV